MDLFDLLILALFALPVVLRWLAKSRKGSGSGPDIQPAESEGAGRHRAGESEFERALREIGRSLQEKAEPARAPTVIDDFAREPAGSGFSREERFEREVPAPPKAAPAPVVPFRSLKLARVDLPQTARPSAAASQTRLLRKTLRSPRKTRQAILLVEILGPPVSLRRR